MMPNPIGRAVTTIPCTSVCTAVKAVVKAVVIASVMLQYLFLSVLCAKYYFIFKRLNALKIPYPKKFKMVANANPNVNPTEIYPER